MTIKWKNLLAFAGALTAALLAAQICMPAYPKLAALFGFNCAIMAVHICRRFGEGLQR